MKQGSALHPPKYLLQKVLWNPQKLQEENYEPFCILSNHEIFHFK